MIGVGGTEDVELGMRDADSSKSHSRTRIEKTKRNGIGRLKRDCRGNLVFSVYSLSQLLLGCEDKKVCCLVEIERLRLKTRSPDWVL